MLAVWSLRLSGFLLRRMVNRSATDTRFSRLRRAPWKLGLLGFWRCCGLLTGSVVSSRRTLGNALAITVAGAELLLNVGGWIGRGGGWAGAMIRC